MITCSEAARQLWEYLDGTLGATDRLAVEEHLGRCRSCCGELEFAEELRGFLAQARDDRIPPDVLRRLHRALEEMEPLTAI